MKPDRWVEQPQPFRILGMRIWSIMQRKGASILDVAKLCGIAPAVVRRWLNGEDKPDDTSAYILARQWGHSERFYQEV